MWWGRSGPASNLILNLAPLYLSISCRAFSAVCLLRGIQVGEVCFLERECWGVVTGDLWVVLLQWLCWLYPSWGGFCVINVRVHFQRAVCTYPKELSVSAVYYRTLTDLNYST